MSDFFKIQAPVSDDNNAIIFHIRQTINMKNACLNRRFCRFRRFDRGKNLRNLRNLRTFF
ncbi:MAG: hypothetical protein V2I97_16875 [Desulfococcaceae bacterium]|nr:hypothetical protein [Desulfococcaceae bacterium]